MFIYLSPFKSTLYLDLHLKSNDEEYYFLSPIIIAFEEILTLPSISGVLTILYMLSRNSKYYVVCCVCNLLHNVYLSLSCPSKIFMP